MTAPDLGRDYFPGLHPLPPPPPYAALYGPLSAAPAPRLAEVVAGIAGGCDVEGRAAA